MPGQNCRSKTGVAPDRHYVNCLTWQISFVLRLEHQPHLSLTKMRIPVLPQELKDCIIAELASFKGVSDPECRQALKACSLTSSSFLTPSRKHLFAKIQLKESTASVWEDPEISLGFARIFDILVEDGKNSLGRHIPRLASHIRTLSVVLSTMRDPIIEDIPDYYTHNGTLPPCLPSILQILNTSSPIASFSFGFPSFGGSYSHWRKVDEPLRDAIESICRLPSITTLQFQWINGLPATLITGCPNLKALSLRWISVDVPTTTTLVRASSPTSLDPKQLEAPDCRFLHLKSLVLNNFRQLLDPLFDDNPSILARLRHIEFSDLYVDPLPPHELEVLKRATALQSIRCKVNCELQHRKYPTISVQKYNDSNI